MKFVKIDNFVLMKTGKTQNDLELESNVIQESVNRHCFDNTPVVFNLDQDFKDYRDKDTVISFIEKNEIGFIIPNTGKFDGTYVTGDVMLQEEFANRTHFDNWMIVYDKDKGYFNYNSCELFSSEEKVIE